MVSELQKGIKVEREHKKTIRFLKAFYKKHGRFPDDDEIYKSIAKDHLSEHRDYYKKLMEAKL